MDICYEVIIQECQYEGRNDIFGSNDSLPGLFLLVQKEEKGCSVREELVELVGVSDFN